MCGFFHSLSIFIDDYAGHLQKISVVGELIRNFIGTFQMPLFMSISGYLFYYEIAKYQQSDQYDIIAFTIKKIRRLLIPFVLIMFLWRKPLLLITERSTISFGTFSELLKKYLITTTTGGLWFLYVLFIIFVIQYRLLKIVWKSKISIGCTLFINLVMTILSYKFSGPIHHVMLYNFYFMLGVLIHEINLSFKAIWDKKKPRSIWICSIKVSAVLSVLYSIGVFSIQLLSSLIFTIIASIDIIVALTFFKDSEISNRVTERFGGYSMGIYLLHEPLMICVGSFVPENLCGGGWSLVILMFSVGLFGAMGIVCLIRKMTLQFVIGE